MSTLLTNRKMNPALRARVEASVSGRRANGATRSRASQLLLKAGLRVGIFGVVAVGVFAFVRARVREHREIEDARAAVLALVRAERGTWTGLDPAATTRSESWLLLAARAYEGDFIAETLPNTAALATVLERPALYVRGPIDSFTHSAGIAEAASASAKDAFLLCLIDPPSSREEKALLPKARAGYSGGSRVSQHTTHVSRLHDLEAGLPLLFYPWEEELNAADTRTSIERLETKFKTAPFAATKRAAHAEILIFAMDEPKTGTGPTEFDGECSHDVRIGIVDVAAAKVLLRMRKHVDPNWISDGARAQFAKEIDGCALAMDVREGLGRKK